jgi:hypothetical protein
VFNAYDLLQLFMLISGLEINWEKSMTFTKITSKNERNLTK